MTGEGIGDGLGSRMCASARGRWGWGALEQSAKREDRDREVTFLSRVRAKCPFVVLKALMLLLSSSYLYTTRVYLQEAY